MNIIFVINVAELLEAMGMSENGSPASDDSQLKTEIDELTKTLPVERGL